jgi:kelch-like protein 2/3
VFVLDVNVAGGAGVAVIDNTLFAIGGHDGPQVKSQCEIYDIETDTWKCIADMNSCRRNAGRDII